MSDKDFIVKKYVGENYKDSLTKNKLYKVHYEDYDDVYIYDNDGYVERCEIIDFIEVNKKEYKSFIIQETQRLFTNNIKEIKDIEDFILSNDPYYTFRNNDKNIENKLFRLREKKTSLETQQIYYEMILEYFNIKED